MAGETESPGEVSRGRMPPGARASRRLRRAFLAGGALLVTASAALWLRSEAAPRERDYHAVRRAFQIIDRKIHDHDFGTWYMVEGGPHDNGADSPAREERHHRILEDFERLGHTQSFAISDVEIEIDGDRAHLRYKLQAWPQPWKPMPQGGRMEFVRRQGEWVLDDHHFSD